MRSRWVVPLAAIGAGLLVVLVVVAARSPRPDAAAAGVVRWWPLVLLAVAVVAGVVLIVPSMLGHRRLREARQEEQGLGRRLMTSVVIVALLVLLRPFPPDPDGVGGLGDGTGFLSGLLGSGADGDGVAADVTGAPSWLLIGLLAVVLLTTLVAVVRTRAAASTGDEEQSPIEHVAARAAISATTEPDPRRAVLLAFAVLEESFAARGVPRAPTETQTAWIARLLVEGGAPPQPARRLAQVFSRARFATAPITEADRAQAIADLGLLTPERATP